MPRKTVIAALALIAVLVLAAVLAGWTWDQAALAVTLG